MLDAGGPRFAVEDEHGLAVLQAVVLLLAVDVLEAVDETIVDDGLLVPKTLGEGRVLVVDVFYNELVLLLAVV